MTTVASEAQTLIVKARPAAPTKSEIIVTQPSVIGGKGTIAGTQTLMEYSTIMVLIGLRAREMYR